MSKAILFNAVEVLGSPFLTPEQRALLVDFVGDLIVKSDLDISTATMLLDLVRERAHFGDPGRAILLHKARNDHFRDASSIVGPELAGVLLSEYEKCLAAAGSTVADLKQK